MATQGTKANYSGKPKTNEKNSKYKSEYMDCNINVVAIDPKDNEEKEMNIVRLGLSQWRPSDPTSTVVRTYVNGQPAGWKKGEPWVKLGYISDDRENQNLGDMDEVTQNLVVATARLVLKK